MWLLEVRRAHSPLPNQKKMQERNSVKKNEKFVRPRKINRLKLKIDNTKICHDRRRVMKEREERETQYVSSSSALETPSSIQHTKHKTHTSTQTHTKFIFNNFRLYKFL